MYLMGFRGLTRAAALLAAVGLAGVSCTARRSSSTTSPVQDLAARDADPNLPEWMWTYARLTNGMSLPTTVPTADEPPLDALDYYGRARAAMLEGSRFTALQHLERAKELDPSSAEVQRLYALAVLEAEGGDAGLAKAGAALARAAELDPQDIENWLRLGRIEVARDRKLQALHAAEMAVLTKEYEEDPLRAAVADLQLARMLTANGFDRAAIERYDLVLEKLPALGRLAQENAEMALLSQRPEVLYVEIAAVYERRGQYRDAARILAKAAALDNDSFETHARYIRALAKAGESEKAMSLAGELVTRHKGNTESMALLTEVYRLAGREEEIVQELRRLLQIRPDDGAVRLALVDALRQGGKVQEAEGVLQDAITRLIQMGKETGESTSRVRMAGLLQKLVDSRVSRGDSIGAARSVIFAGAEIVRAGSATSGKDWPDLIRLTRDLTEAGNLKRVSLRDLLALELQGEEAAVRDFLASRVAHDFSRSNQGMRLTYAASERLVPALLACVDETLLATTLTSVRRSERLEELRTRAGRLGGRALLLAVEGRIMLAGGRHGEAAKTLADAVAGGVTDVQTQLYLLTAVARAGAPQLIEQIYARLAIEYPFDPTVQEGYIEMLAAGQRWNEAEQALGVWAIRDSNRWEPLLAQSKLLLLRGQRARAESIVLQLLERVPDQRAVIQAVVEMYQLSGRGAQAETKLAAVVDSKPRSLAALAQYAALAAANGRSADAERAIMQAKAACAGSSDLLYQIAAICQLAGLDAAAVPVLQEGLKADPTDISVANDYAYIKAEMPDVTRDELTECERLAQMVVEKEPETASYIDTLGWVKYRQGNFKEAVELLKKASTLAGGSDPTLLDHLGDAYFRLGNLPEAAATWKRAYEAFGSETEGVASTLKLKLQSKIRTLDAGGEPTVAPVAK